MAFCVGVRVVCVWRGHGSSCPARFSCVCVRVAVAFVALCSRAHVFSSRFWFLGKKKKKKESLFFTSHVCSTLHGMARFRR